MNYKNMNIKYQSVKCKVTNYKLINQIKKLENTFDNYNMPLSLVQLAIYMITTTLLL